MPVYLRFLALALFAGCAADVSRPDATPTAQAAPPTPADSIADWSVAFEAQGAVGTFVLLDTATGRRTRHDPARAATRFTPASTSKVWNSLVFLDRGVVTDVDSMYAWDGVERQIGSWNRDHSLRTGVQNSAVWLFQRLALEVGHGGYAAVLAKEPYGNSTMSESLEMSWLDGSLRVSADEQVVFFDRLRRGDLAFSAAHQATVRDLLPVLAEADGAMLRAKTGWGGYDAADGTRVQLGWLVGWVERPEGDVVFALNAEAAPTERFDVGPGRLRIVRAVLEREGLWPAATDDAP